LLEALVSDFEFRKFVGWLIEPLSIATICFIFATLSLGRQTRRAAGFWLATGVATLWISATPWFAHRVFSPLEHAHAPLSTESLNANAARGRAIMVVLGGGHEGHCSDSLKHSPSQRGNARVQQAAALYRASPRDFFERVVVTGHRSTQFDCKESEADAMAASLEALGVPAGLIVRDSASRTTQENASGSLALIANTPAHAKQVVIVTSAFHMQRAMREFANAQARMLPNHASLNGVEYVAAPTLPETPTTLNTAWSNALPTVSALRQTTRALKEHLGLFEFSRR
jgi:uncharacterized SAM-binding protein YcdF (DUF218 family)